MARWWLLIVCPLAGVIAAALLLALLAAPGVRAEEAETVVVCRAPALAIPDGAPAGITDTLSISSDRILVDVQVILATTHDWAGDLVVELSRDETGIVVPLLDRLGVSAANPDGCDAAMGAILFTDAAANGNCTWPLTGTLRPAFPQAMLAGQPVSGTWRLHVTDVASRMAGTLDRWCLQATVAAAPRLVLTPGAVAHWVAPGLTDTVAVTLTNRGSADWMWGTAPASIGGTMILSERFETSTGLPPGWERQTALITATWQVLPGTGRDGANAALVPGANGNAQDEWLISPPLGLQQGWLAYWTRGSATACRLYDTCDLEVWLLPQSGEAVLLGSADDGWAEEGAWTPQAWDLTPYLPVSGPVRVGFRYTSSGGSAEARLDDVLISGLERPAGCRETKPAWIEMLAVSEPLAPGAQTSLTLTLSATDLVTGTYSGTACVPGNDPLAPLLPLLVTANVDNCVQHLPMVPALTIAAGANGEASLSWQAQAGDIRYILERGVEPYAQMPWLALPAGSSIATDPAPGSAAFYRLIAHNCSGEEQAVSNRVGWLRTTLAASDGAAWDSLSMALAAGNALNEAAEVAAAIPGTEQVLRWVPAIQNFDYFAPPNSGTNFAAEAGAPLFVLRGGAAETGFVLSGAVPEPGTVSFTMVGGTPCRWNHVSLPLEQGLISSAQDLAEAIRGDDSTAVEQVLVWDAAQQAFAYWIPAPVGGATGMGTNFATAIGGDYFVCLKRDATWP